MNDLHSAFMYGALRLVGNYSPLHRAHGVSPDEWNLLTRAEYWTPDEVRTVRSTLANIIEACLTLSGMPAVSLPGQYAAAVIAVIVAPPNRMVACMKCPDTFDGIRASGLMGTSEIVPMRHEQLMGLVMHYSGHGRGEPALVVPAEVKEIKKKDLAR